MDNSYTIPFAIVVAGALVASAVIYTSSDPSTNTGDSNNADSEKQQTIEQADIRPVTEDDHILGNPNAEIKIVEYSDFECPFCKDFHDTMHRIIDEYGKDGQVAWVFRHFPVEQLHSKAPKEAQAAECASQIGGEQAFWDYADRVFEVTPSNNGLDLTRLPEIAEDVGLDREAFNQCLESDETKDEVQKDLEDARRAAKCDENPPGSNCGTPFNVIVAGDKKVPFAGAYRYDTLRSIIESILTGAVPAEALPQR